MKYLIALTLLLASCSSNYLNPVSTNNDDLYRTSEYINTHTFLEPEFNITVYSERKSIIDTIKIHEYTIKITRTRFDSIRMQAVSFTYDSVLYWEEVLYKDTVITYPYPTIEETTFEGMKGILVKGSSTIYNERDRNNFCYWYNDPYSNAVTIPDTIFFFTNYTNIRTQEVELECYPYKATVTQIWSNTGFVIGRSYLEKSRYGKVNSKGGQYGSRLRN